MMLVIPRFTLRNILTGKDEEFEFCVEGKCSQTISYQVRWKIWISKLVSTSFQCPMSMKNIFSVGAVFPPGSTVSKLASVPVV